MNIREQVAICRDVQTEINKCARELGLLICLDDSELAECLRENIKDSFNKLLDAKNHLNAVVD